MKGSLDNFSNLDFLIPDFSQPDAAFKKAFVFMDDKLRADGLADYLNAKVPQHLRSPRPIYHYHSSMSKYYKDVVFPSFKELNGSVKILISTESASNVSIVLLP
jgi:superfamily II DNA/RNA helicase